MLFVICHFPSFSDVFCRFLSSFLFRLSDQCAILACACAPNHAVTWDGMNKKKLTTLQRFPTSISALAYSFNGRELAIASSYTFEEGEREHPKDEIFIRKMLDSECMPKKKS